MALDVALFDAAETGDSALRVYAWDGPWVSFGRFQDPARDLLDPSVPYVIRPTGGKAVLHGHDVTVGIAAPFAALGLSHRSLKGAYRAIVQPLITALNQAGVPAALAEDTVFGGRGQKTADCFAFRSPNDIVHAQTGVKVCGCALRLGANAVLAQASLPAGPPLADPRLTIREAVPVPVTEWDIRAFVAALQATPGFRVA